MVSTLKLYLRVAYDSFIFCDGKKFTFPQEQVLGEEVIAFNIEAEQYFIQLHSNLTPCSHSELCDEHFFSTYSKTPLESNSK